MIRSSIVCRPHSGLSFARSALIVTLSLSSCMTPQKQAAIVDDSQDVAAILPTATPDTMTAKTPGAPEAMAAEKNAEGSAVPPDHTKGSLPQEIVTNGVAPDNSGDPVQALGIMQSTRVNAGSGSIFSNLTNDQAAYNPNDPNAAASIGTAVKPIKKSLFSMSPQASVAPQMMQQDMDVIVPPASASGDPIKDPNYDAGIVVMHRQSDEERRIMADKNDLAKNANPQIRAMEPDAQAAPANAPSVKAKKKPWSLKDMFGDLGKSAGNGKSTSTQ